MQYHHLHQRSKVKEKAIFVKVCDVGGSQQIFQVASELHCTTLLIRADAMLQQQKFPHIHKMIWCTCNSNRTKYEAEKLKGFHKNDEDCGSLIFQRSDQSTRHLVHISFLYEIFSSSFGCCCCFCWWCYCCCCCSRFNVCVWMVALLVEMHGGKIEVLWKLK